MPVALVTDQNVFCLPWKNGVTQQTNLEDQHVGG